jgi:hypothetical protein
MRAINDIARDIRIEWSNKIYFGAVPYLDAMTRLTSAEDKYGFDDARSILRYFLANARTFRGERAKALKAEIKTILGE